MVELLQMWALVEVLGLLCLPLTITVFHNLPDRGWAFSKTIGIALLAFCVWLPLMTVQLLPFSRLFIGGVLSILCAFSIVGFVRVRHALVEFVRTHIFYIIVCEAVFLGMVFLLGWIRSYGPNIQNFEMYMDEGFLAAIMRSPHFPPNDMWFSGYSINYYYYAHYTIALLAKLLGQSPSIAFNTGICIFFGLTAVNLFGVTCNVVSWARYQHKSRAAVSGTSEKRSWSTFTRRRKTGGSQHQDIYSDQPDSVLPSLNGAIPFGFLTILMGEVLGNLASTQQWWQAHDDLPPEYWFNTTRIIDKTINEFPAFSFLLSCFHAHVLALAFTIVAIALAFNLFLEYGGDGKGRGLRVFGSGWRLPFNLGVTALILGGLFAMNGWDFPTYLTLAIICIGLQQWMAYQSRFRFDLILDVFTVVAALTALSFFLYSPFYLSFVSPSQGIGIVGAADRSAIGDEVLIYGLFVFIYVSLLVVNLFRPRFSAKAFSGQQSLAPDSSKSNQINLTQVGQDYKQVNHASGILTTASGSLRMAPIQQQEGGTVSRNVVSVPLMGMTSSADQPLEEEKVSHDVDEAAAVDQEYQLRGTQPSTRKRFILPDWLDLRVISIVVILGVALLSFAIMKNALTFAVAFTIAALGAALALYHLHDRPRAFTMLLGALAFGLVAMTEIIFLKDVFAGSYPRMNTVFKFYFQAWALLSITCGAALYFIYEGFQSVVRFNGWQRWVGRGVQVIWSVALLVFFLAGMVYPIVGSYQRTNHYMQRTNSLDGLNYLQSYDPGDYTAIKWLNSNVQGSPVIVEAFNPQGDYSDYGRISAFTGLPTLMGWAGHEYQWRVNWLNNAYNAADFYGRGADISAIYTNTNPEIVLSLMKRYNARYIYVGSLEKTTYPQANLNRFSGFMQTVYSANGVTIYQVPES
jgi:YYY domain-containing protein